MSDGNITHHHSPTRKNTSLGNSPDMQRNRTTSTSSTGSLSPIIKSHQSMKRPLPPTSTSSESEQESQESEESFHSASKSTSITSVFASLEFKSAKKSYSRLPHLSKKIRMSCEDNETPVTKDPVGARRNSTPLSALTEIVARRVRFSTKDENNLSDESVRFSTPVRSHNPTPPTAEIGTPLRTPKRFELFTIFSRLLHTKKIIPFI